MRVGLVEQMILNYDALPEEFLGWRNFRIEYGGHAQDCIMERTIFVPPNFDVHKFEEELREAAQSFDYVEYDKSYFNKNPNENRE